MLVHNWPGFYRDDGFRGRRAVAQGTLWSFGVVVFSPFLDQDLRVPQAVEDFALQQFISKAGVETLAVSLFPRGSRFDVGGLGSDRCHPISDGLSNEFGAVDSRYPT